MLREEKSRLTELQTVQRDEFNSRREYERELRTVCSNVDIILNHPHIQESLHETSQRTFFVFQLKISIKNFPNYFSLSPLTKFIFSHILWIGKQATSCWCGWHLKSETKAEHESESWQATEKPESKARHMGWSVGGQQKNQSIREMHNATVL